MKVIVAGSRYLKDYTIVENAIKESGFNVTEIVSGGAQGVDSLGELWAKVNSVPHVQFLADWQKFGLKAGPLRNSEMSAYTDALVLIWDGHSPGSADMKKKAKAAGLPIFEKIIPGRTK